MERTPVQSSNIAAIGYDDTNAILEVEFLNGSIYQYYGVPHDTYESLMNAASKGSFLNSYVKKAGYSVARVQ
ncbi:MAG: KTSC domain-containing protein [bacterium]|nr:KTSC domain-containing protein [bacterium]